MESSVGKWRVRQESFLTEVGVKDFKMVSGEEVV